MFLVLLSKLRSYFLGAHWFREKARERKIPQPIKKFFISGFCSEISPKAKKLWWITFWPFFDENLVNNKQKEENAHLQFCSFAPLPKCLNSQKSLQVFGWLAELNLFWESDLRKSLKSKFLGHIQNCDTVKTLFCYLLWVLRACSFDKSIKRFNNDGTTSVFNEYETWVSILNDHSGWILVFHLSLSNLNCLSI